MVEVAAVLGVEVAAVTTERFAVDLETRASATVLTPSLGVPTKCGCGARHLGAHSGALVNCGAVAQAC